MSAKRPSSPMPKPTPKMTPKLAPPPAMPMGQAMRDNKMPAMPAAPKPKRKK